MQPSDNVWLIACAAALILAVVGPLMKSIFIDPSDNVAYVTDERIGHEERMSQLLRRSYERDSQPGRTKPGGSWVYFIQQGDTGPIKIGLSTKPDQRMRDLQTAHAQRLKMLAMMPGGSSLEIALHAKFSNYRLQGEWFAPAPAILQYISDLSGNEVEAGQSYQQHA